MTVALGFPLQPKSNAPLCLAVIILSNRYVHEGLPLSLRFFLQVERQVV